nr:MAG TPA: hypothetical protein [Caudoviricetes sp.]
MCNIYLFFLLYIEQILFTIHSIAIVWLLYAGL